MVPFPVQAIPPSLHTYEQSKNTLAMATADAEAAALALAKDSIVSYVSHSCVNQTSKKKKIELDCWGKKEIEP